jgi:ABC-type sugar transport system ATPase subunit
MFERLLEVTNVSMSFPGLKALDRVSTRVGSGEIVAVVGQNGSGKSTLVKILAGVHRPDPGSEINLAEGPDGAPTALHFIHQDLGLVGSLSTIENLDLDHPLGKSALWPARRREERRHAEELIGDFGATFDVGVPVAQLSAAERTVVAIARAFDGWEHPQNVLVLDEPTASLHDREVQKLFVAVRRAAERGAGVIFISHRLEEVIELADRVVVLRDGQLIADVERGGFDHDGLVSLVAGAVRPAETFDTPTGLGAEPALRARAIRGPTIESLDIDLHVGEVLGISGVLGSGREEVASILFGAGRGSVAELEICGRSVRRLNPRRAIAAGIAYLPGDRHRDGAFMTLSARENMTLPRLDHVHRVFRNLDLGSERAEVEGWIERMAVRPADPSRPLRLFSGGNQQKVLLAKWLRNDPRILLLDEPTQGVDVGAKAGILELIAAAAAGGTGVLICSSDDRELASVCDRVLVMRDGRLVADASGDELNEAMLVAAGLGSSASRGEFEPQTDREAISHGT